jgi:predicted transcriptional regulator
MNYDSSEHVEGASVKDDTKQRLERGIARGEAAIKAGRVLTQAQAKRKMAKWLRNRDRH